VFFDLARHKNGTMPGVRFHCQVLAAGTKQLFYEPVVAICLSSVPYATPS
jgi:hypothetical protein